MRKILVTAISGDIGNGVLKILQGVKCEAYGCDVNQYAAGMDKVKDFYKVPLASDENYIAQILEICKKRKIQYIIPTNERELEALSQNRSVFEKEKIHLVMQKNKVLELCLDKLKTMKFLESQEILTPCTCIATEELKMGKKVIVKPRKSNGSKNIRIYEPEEALPIEKQNENYIIQEYVPGDQEYTIGIFSDGKICNRIIFKRKLKNGYSDFVELIENKEIDEIAYKISSVFHLYGFINVQMREWEGKHYIIEINPRISGTVYFRHMLGYCDVLWWLDCMDGKDILPYVCNYEKAIGLRELCEKYVEIAVKTPSSVNRQESD